MKKNILLKCIYIFLIFFVAFSQLNFVYAAKDRDESLSGVVQDGSSFIEIRRRTKYTNSPE